MFNLSPEGPYGLFKLIFSLGKGSIFFLKLGINCYFFTKGFGELEDLLLEGDDVEIDLFYLTFGRGDFFF